MATDVLPSHLQHFETRERVRGDPRVRVLVPIGRVLFASMFVLSGLGHFAQQTIAYAAAQGVPAPSLLVPLSGIMAIVGGLSVALGYRTRVGALLLVLFLVPVTLKMHAFWAVTDPMMRGIQQINFMKNVSMLGAALLLLYFGAGPISIDERVEHPARPST
jgi:putative oxidoreductase